MKLSEKWFEQSFDRGLAGIRTSDGAKTRSLGGPKDLAINALGTFQTVSEYDFSETGDETSRWRENPMHLRPVANVVRLVTTLA